MEIDTLQWRPHRPRNFDMSYRNDRDPGFEIRGPDGKWHEFLTAGKRYHVIQQFIDFDKGLHLSGEQWLFKGYSYFPYDEGTTFFVSVDGIHESTIRIQGDRNEILSHLETYLAPVTSEKAFSSLTKAAEQGNADAQFNLGAMYAIGQGVAKDQKTAVLWYIKAAEQGNAYAQFNLGAMYAYGRGVVKDEKTAIFWYTKAAEQGMLRLTFISP
jgi:TPR repeat protein